MLSLQRSQGLRQTFLQGCFGNLALDAQSLGSCLRIFGLAT